MKSIRFVVLIIVLAVAMPMSAASTAEQTKAERRELYREGAREWAIYCGQCHNVRPGAEFSPAQWQTIMMHMRSRANLPARNSRAMLEFLKAR